MSSSIISFPTIFFISSILILTSTPKNTIASASLIQKACSNDYTDIDTELCIRVLQSVPSIVSAKDIFNLSIAIMEAGISNSTKTRVHIENLLNRTHVNPRGKAAFQECKLSYDLVVDRFEGAMEEVRVGEYQIATYDLLTASTDCIKSCERALASQKIEDEIILKGNKIIPMFGLSAFSVICELEDQFRSPAHIPHHY